MSRSPCTISSGSFSVSASFAGSWRTCRSNSPVPAARRASAAPDAWRSRRPALPRSSASSAANAESSTGALAGFDLSCSRMTSPILRPGTGHDNHAANPVAASGPRQARRARPRCGRGPRRNIAPVACAASRPNCGRRSNNRRSSLVRVAYRGLASEHPALVDTHARDAFGRQGLGEQPILRGS